MSLSALQPALRRTAAASFRPAPPRTLLRPAPPATRCARSLSNLALRPRERSAATTYALGRYSLSRRESKTGTGGSRGMASAAGTDAQAAAAANTSGVTAESLQGALRERLGAEEVLVQDISGGCGQSFEAVVVAAQFEKKTTLARHRLVNAALKAEIAAIHAWTPKCYTPEEWERRNKS